MSDMHNDDLEFQDRYQSQNDLAQFTQENLFQLQQQQQQLNQNQQQLNKKQQLQHQLLNQQQQSETEEQELNQLNDAQQQNSNTFQGNVEVDQNYQPTEDQILDYAKYLGFELPQDQQLLWIAREGLKAPLPQPWRPCRNIDGDIYFFNFQTGKSIWEHPSDQYYRYLFQEKKAQLKGLAEGFTYRDERASGCSGCDDQTKLEENDDDNASDDHNDNEVDGKLKSLQAIQMPQGLMSVQNNSIDHNKKQQNQAVNSLPKKEEARLQDELIQNSAHFPEQNEDSAKMNQADNENNQMQDKIVVEVEKDQANHHAHEFTLAQRGEFIQELSDPMLLDQQTQKKSFQFDFQQELISAGDQFLHGSQNKIQKSKQPKHQERRVIYNEDKRDRIYFAQQQENFYQQLHDKVQPTNQINESLDFVQALDNMPANNQNGRIDSPQNFALNLPQQGQEPLAQFGQNIAGSDQHQTVEQQLKPFPAP